MQITDNLGFFPFSPLCWKYVTQLRISNIMTIDQDEDNVNRLRKSGQKNACLSFTTLANTSAKTAHIRSPITYIFILFT